MDGGQETGGGAENIRTAEIVLPSQDVDADVGFFTGLGFRLSAIHPADAPTTALVTGHGLRIRLQRGSGGSPGVLRLACREPASVGGGVRELVAPNGTLVRLVEAEPGLELPPLRPSFVLTRAGEAARWGRGRAGMRYRDLVPDRQGGRFIASHIRIPDGGPVPDYVHYHRVRFQMIYCYRGWVRVVYEDQGPPFVLQAGDCVLQPPEIRHRVLESSPGLEVIEITSPAEHETLVEHDLELPTAAVRRERTFGGQRFVRHVAARAAWGPWRLEGFEARDLGIAAATGGLAGASVVRPTGTAAPRETSHDGELCFLFVLAGTASLTTGDHGSNRLAAGDAVVVPAGERFALVDCSGDAELLEVTLPAGPGRAAGGGFTGPGA